MTIVDAPRTATPTTSPPPSRRPSRPRPGLTRDAVRMLVAYRESGTLVPSSFVFLPRFLDAGDLLVITHRGPFRPPSTRRPTTGTRWSSTCPPSSSRRAMGGRATSGGRPDAPSDGPVRRLRARCTWPDGASLALEEPYGERGRLWIAPLELGERTLSWLAVHGRPIRYGYVEGRGPSRCTRTSTPPSRAAPRCPVPGGPSRRRSSPGWSPRGWASPHWSSTPGSPRWRPTSSPTRSGSRCPNRRPSGSTPPTAAAIGSSPWAPPWCGRSRRRREPTATPTPTTAGPTW